MVGVVGVCEKGVAFCRAAEQAVFLNVARLWPGAVAGVAVWVFGFLCIMVLAPVSVSVVGWRLVWLGCQLSVVFTRIFWLAMWTCPSPFQQCSRQDADQCTVRPEQPSLGACEIALASLVPSSKTRVQASHLSGWVGGVLGGLLFGGVVVVVCWLETVWCHAPEVFPAPPRDCETLRGPAQLSCRVLGCFFDTLPSDSEE